MLLTPLISPYIPSVTPSDTEEDVLSVLSRNNLEHVAMVDNDHYIALIQEKDLLDRDKPDEQLKDGHFENFKPAVMIGAHPYDALRIMHLHNLDVVPVVHENFEYAGCITKDSLFKYLVENAGIDIQGGIVVLEVNAHDYSLSEIARICESEQVVVISSQLKTNVESGKLEITIKTNRTDLSGLIQSFERHDYTILATFGDKELENDIIDRYKLLMNYINM